MEYHDQTLYLLLSKFLKIHNEQVDDKKKIMLGRVTVTDPNNSLYRFTNYETTMEVIMTKMVDKSKGYLCFVIVDLISNSNVSNLVPS